MRFITVTIGRGTGDGAMTDSRWASFTADTGAVVEFDSYRIVGTLFGASEWEGQAEETFAIQAEATDGQVARLRIALAILARRYKQDGIGLHFGEVISASKLG